MLLREHVMLRAHMKLLRDHVKLLRAHVKGITCARKKFPKKIFSPCPFRGSVDYSTKAVVTDLNVLVQKTWFPVSMW